MAPKEIKLQNCVNGDADSDTVNTKKELIESVIDLEEIDINLFRSYKLWKPIGARGVFGGQVIGQALVAASKTKQPDLHVHSLHCYFLKPGDVSYPILYHVDRTRNGNSFCTRTVTAVQNGEKIFTMIVSFHQLEESVIQHQYPMPKTPGPDDLLSYEDILKTLLSDEKVSDKRKYFLNKVLAQDLAMDIKPVDALGYARIPNAASDDKDIIAPGSLTQLLWIRAKGNMDHVENNVHRCMAAYLTDYTLLRSALMAHPHFRPRMMASLDHSIWFHTEFRADEWMLYESESPRMVGGRGLAIGRLWKQDGTLAASVAQEGIIRGEVVERKSKL